MTIEEQKIPQRDLFQYLDSRISKDGGLRKMLNKIGVARLMRRLPFGVLCDRCMLTRLKESFYRKIIGPAMTNGVEC